MAQSEVIMADNQSQTQFREAVAVFSSAAALQEAADELLISGFDRADLSLLATKEALQDKFAGRYRSVQDLEDETGVPYTAFVGPDSKTEAKAGITGALAYVGAVASAGAVVASGGALLPAVGAAVAAGSAGGAIGSYLAQFIEEKHAGFLEGQIRNGGLLLWVRTSEAELEDKAREILERQGGRDVHFHDIAAEAHADEGGVSRELSFIRHLGL